MKRLLSSILLITAELYAYATIQTCEMIHIGDATYEIKDDLPLDQFPLIDSLLAEYSQVLTPTNLYRGYVGYWTIRDNQLYLDSLQMYDSKTIIASSNPLFANYRTSAGVVATWFSGNLHVVSTSYLDFRNYHGFDDKYSFKDGQIVAKKHYERKQIIYGTKKVSFLQVEKLLADKYPELNGKLTINTRAVEIDSIGNITQLSVWIVQNQTTAQVLESDEIVSFIESFLLREPFMDVYFLYGKCIALPILYTFDFSRSKEERNLLLQTAIDKAQTTSAED